MALDKIIVKIDDEDLIDIIEPYLQNRRNDITTLRDALAKRDHETIRNLGHKMKGSGGGYGLDRISEIGRDMEEAAKSQDSDAMKAAIIALQDFLERVEITF